VQEVRFPGIPSRFLIMNPIKAREQMAG